MHVPVTLLYAAFTTLLITLLGGVISLERMTKKIGIGAEVPPQMQRHIRAHGNAAEWAPLLLLMLLIVELTGGASSMTLHLLGGGILAGRVIHALGVYTKTPLSTLGATVNYALAAALPIYALYLRFR